MLCGLLISWAILMPYLTAGMPGDITEIADVTSTSDQMKIFDTLNSSGTSVTVIDVRDDASLATRPVEMVSFNNALAYCAALTALETAAGRVRPMPGRGPAPQPTPQNRVVSYRCFSGSSPFPGHRQGQACGAG